MAAQTNTIQAGYVAESGATLVEFATPDETISAVINGEADAVLADGAYIQEQIEATGGQLVSMDSVMIGGGLGIGVRESDTELKAKLNAALAQIKKDGRLNDLIIKWFDDESKAIY